MEQIVPSQLQSGEQQHQQQQQQQQRLGAAAAQVELPTNVELLLAAASGRYWAGWCCWLNLLQSPGPLHGLLQGQWCWKAARPLRLDQKAEQQQQQQQGLTLQAVECCCCCCCWHTLLFVAVAQQELQQRKQVQLGASHCQANPQEQQRRMKLLC
jgi:hypothetical protein